MPLFYLQFTIHNELHYRLFWCKMSHARKIFQKVKFFHKFSKNFSKKFRKTFLEMYFFEKFFQFLKKMPFLIRNFPKNAQFVMKNGIRYYQPNSLKFVKFVIDNFFCRAPIAKIMCFLNVSEHLEARKKIGTSRKIRALVITFNYICTY